jgi:N-acetylated-alpha-linked acidic dipeptidase
VEDAERFGAVGVLIYSDPLDDGYRRGAVVPDGPFRSNSSLQRGSVFSGEGDPLTPGYAAVLDAETITVAQSRNRSDAINLGFNLPSIPSLPLSLDDALPMLKALKGVKAPSQDWLGGVNEVPYNLGCAA